MNTTHKQNKNTFSASLGKTGESLACRYLKEKGYTILETNFQNKKGYRVGELDIIAQKDKEIVFVEVKTRLHKHGEVIFPEENVTREKLLKLEKIASLYIRTSCNFKVNYHFDVLAIVVDTVSRKAKIRHLEHVFL